MWIEVSITDHGNYSCRSEYKHFVDNLSLEEINERLYYNYVDGDVEWVVKIIDKPPQDWLEREYNHVNKEVQSLLTYRELLYDCMLATPE